MLNESPTGERPFHTALLYYWVRTIYMKNQGQAEARRRLIRFEASMSLEGEPTFSCLPGTSRDIYAQNRTKSKVFHSSDMVALLLRLNRPSKIRKYSQLIGEFRVVFFLCFKASLVANLCCNLKH